MDGEIAQVPLADWDFWSRGLDREFFSRVYKKTTAIGVIAVLCCLGFEQQKLALGMLSGLAVGLMSLWTVEMTVKLLFHGGQHAGLKLALGALVKAPFSLAGLVGIAWAAYNGHMNIFGVVGGVLLVHASILVMTIATAVASMDRNTERYR